MDKVPYEPSSSLTLPSPFLQLSPSHNVQAGYFRQEDEWEIVFEMGALLQGLVMLYPGSRMAISPARFRAFCHRSFWRYLHGICA